MGNDDSPERTIALTAATPATEPASAQAATPNEAGRRPSPAPTTSAPKPPEAARPKTTKSPATATPKATESSSPAPRAKKKTSKPKLRVLSTGSCGASFYGEPQMTASGERFNPSAMTAAHKTLPLGSKVRVTNPNNGESVTVRINDRGPYVGGRCLDLSTAAFAAIGNTSAGVMRVKYEVLAR
ncbi:septal ring lytic transglycosylase RlpA family protein [Nonomuraea zeae]|uniref:Probable endolytic peptidoglycan transglycosylase RlpA n=1 Tax=Nonomuraea zeae TaxID=1642303 RepID=A0A5S4F7R8_9ACTN|nr:septal ring lytic transglycosylase RlpA family protein [Nonomuraea zeae]